MSRQPHRWIADPLRGITEEVDPFGPGLPGNHHVVGHKIALQAFPEGLADLSIRFDDQVIPGAADREKGAESSLRRENACRKGLALTQAPEISCDLAVEITEGVGPREAETDTRGHPEGPAFASHPLQQSGIKIHAPATI